MLRLDLFYRLLFFYNLRKFIIITMLTNLIGDLIDLLINNVLFALQIDLEKTVRKIGFILRSIRYAL